MVFNLYVKFMIVATLACSVVIADVILYDIVPAGANSGLANPALLSTRYSTGGVDSEGKTTYIEEIALHGAATKNTDVSKVVQPVILKPVQSSVTVTFAADASLLVAEPLTLTVTGPNATPAVVKEDCAYEGTTRGACVNQLIFSGSSGFSTVIATVTGTLRPIATLSSSSRGTGLSLRTGKTPIGLMETIAGILSTMLLLHIML